MFYTIGDTKIHYHETGHGKPVVLLHGLGCDYRLMEGCMEPIFRLHPGYRRIYIDLPGMGRSKAPLKEASSDKILEILTSMIEELVKEPFLLVGESYGGYLSRGILASHLSAYIDGIMLICPVVKPEHSTRRVPNGAVRLVDEAFLNQLSGKDREGFEGDAVVVDSFTYERYQREIVPGLEMGEEAFLKKLESSYAFSFDVDERIRGQKYEKPVLFLTGRQDTCVGYEDLWSLLEDYPRATFAVLDLAGHNLQIEQPNLFESLADDWIRRTEKKVL